MRKVLVTRHINKKDISYANSLSLDIDIVEAISFNYRIDREAIKAIFSPLEKYDLIFTSVNAVHSLEVLLHEDLLDSKKIENIYCVGKKTARRIADMGFDSIIPETHNAESLADLIIGDKTNPLVYLKGNLSRDIIFEKLNESGKEIYETEVYQTTQNEVKLELQRYDAIMFYSPSAVKAIAANNDIHLADVKLFSIGKTTASALEKITNKNIFISDKQDTTSFIKFVSENL